MVEWRLASIAKSNLVPTPSVELTKIGLLKPSLPMSKSPPNPPNPPIDPILSVVFAYSAISSTNASPASMSTPDSL